MKTQAQITREYNTMASVIGQPEIKRLRASTSQTIEQKLDVMILNYNIWMEEHPANDLSTEELDAKIEEVEEVTPVSKQKEPTEKTVAMFHQINADSKETGDQVIPLIQKNKEYFIHEMTNLEYSTEEIDAFVETLPAAEEKVPAKPTSSNRPKVGSKTEAVWAIADRLKGCSRKEILDACLVNGINPGTASTQYSKWAKENK